MNIQIRRMEARDLAFALKLSHSQGWPHKFEDLSFYFDLGIGLVASDDNGNPIGTLMWWPYGDNFAMIGWVIVENCHQGKGVGRRLMDSALKEIGSRTLRLVATPSGQHLYNNCGFENVKSICQIQGIATATEPLQPPPNTLLRNITERDIDLVAQLDQAAFAADRRQMIFKLISMGPGYIISHEEKMMGFAFSRIAGRGRVIGPVVANDQQSSKVLISKLLSINPGFTRIDLMAEATEILNWLNLHELHEVDRGLIMQRGVPSLSKGQPCSIALASQALG